jgi:hypothetical protein
MSVFKRINVSDSFVVPYTANKSFDFTSESFSSNQLFVNIGTKTDRSFFDPNSEYKSNYQYDSLVYSAINNIYYPSFLPTSSDNSSLRNTIFDVGNLATSSYYNGFVELGNLDTEKFFPTGSDGIIYVLNIPRQFSGDGILPSTFEITINSGSSYEASIYDDGNYNLRYSGSNIDSSIGTILSNGSYVGNIFYEQNIAILTIIPKSMRQIGWRPIDPFCVTTP